MPQINVNIRMDDDLRREFDSLCSNLGLTMTAAFNVFARAAVRRQKIPFELSMDTPNIETMADAEEFGQIKKIRHQAKQGRTADAVDM